MLLSSNTYRYDESIPAETVISEYDTRFIDSGMMNERRSINTLQLDDLSIDYRKEGTFFEGFILFLPISVLLWGIIILAVKTLFF